jgi:hypothetical protein
VTPTQSGYSTPTAGPSNLSILPPSSPPDNFWDDLHRSTSDIEQDRGTDDDKSTSESDISDPSSPASVSVSMEVENMKPKLYHGSQLVLNRVMGCTCIQSSARRFWSHSKSFY